ATKVLIRMIACRPWGGSWKILAIWMCWSSGSTASDVLSGAAAHRVDPGVYYGQPLGIGNVYPQGRHTLDIGARHAQRNHRFSSNARFEQARVSYPKIAISRHLIAVAIRSHRCGVTKIHGAQAGPIGLMAVGTIHMQIGFCAIGDGLTAIQWIWHARQACMWSRIHGKITHARQGLNLVGNQVARINKIAIELGGFQTQYSLVSGLTIGRGMTGHAFCP